MGPQHKNHNDAVVTTCLIILQSVLFSTLFHSLQQRSLCLFNVFASKTKRLFYYRTKVLYCIDVATHTGALNLFYYFCSGIRSISRSVNIAIQLLFGKIVQHFYSPVSYDSCPWCQVEISRKESLGLSHRRSGMKYLPIRFFVHFRFNCK